MARSVDWRSLYQKDMPWHEAARLFDNEAKCGYINARDPYRKGSTRGVACPYDAVTHTLFKPADETEGREREENQKRQKTCDRVRWIKHVLMAPDELRQEISLNKGKSDCFIYICKPWENERFVVIVKGNRQFLRLVTAYTIDTSEPKDKKYWDDMVERSMRL